MHFKFSKFNAVLAKNHLITITTDKIDKVNLNKKLYKFTENDLSLYFKNADFKGDSGSSCIIPTLNKNLKLLSFIGAGKKSKLNEEALKNLGAKIFDATNKKSNKDVCIYFDANLDVSQQAIIVFGFKLRSYFFNAFITKKTDTMKCHVEKVSFFSESSAQLEKETHKYLQIVDGVKQAKDLTNEPPNKLFPETYAEKCAELKKIGLKVQILTPNEMKKLGMGALLGVAQGSSNEARLVVMEWTNGKKSEKPLAFVGKGVTFDTGGLSLKPAASMVGMKYDMAGSAAVTGLMKTLALRKAKVNVVGVIGLVENMPDGNAQRPEDIVTSMSGQTIEVLNTDAEGRLVLADALWYTQEKYDPKFIIDLATLTGAIIVALADKHAGIFSNNDKLCQQLQKAGIQTGEKVWRLPISAEYDKMIDSKIADMQNISAGYGAGSITAAQFLQRFVNKKPWVHIDIAGVDNIKGSTIHQHGATGFGVQLLNRFIEDYYEPK